VERRTRPECFGVVFLVNILIGARRCLEFTSPWDELPLPDANKIDEMNAAKLGLKFDDLGRVRVVDDDTAVTTGELHGESNELLDSESNNKQ
jgi:hypothetical protein